MTFTTIFLKQVVPLLKFSKKCRFNLVHIHITRNINLRGITVQNILKNDEMLNEKNSNFS
jgi:hypothetical protein